MKPGVFVRRVWSIHARRGDYFFLASKSKVTGKWGDHSFQWPCKVKLDKFFEDHPDKKYNLYFCPTPFTHPKRLKSHVRASQLLWADLDDARPQSIKPVPQIAWSSSPNRYACLWVLSQQHEPSVIEEKNKALTYSSKDSDKTGWDLTQVLRIPGTANHKYNGSPKGQLLWFKENTYRLDDIQDYEEEDEDPQEVLKHWRKKMPRAVYQTLTSRFVTMGKRSEVLWRLEAELADIGMTAGEIFTLIKHSKWNKFTGRRDEDRQLKREIEKVVESKPDTASRKTITQEAVKESPWVNMADVEEEDVSFLWFPYIPFGKITIIEGDPGLGKSWCTMAIASAFSQRQKLPGQTHAKRGRVLVMSAEDGLADTLKKRLRQLGANYKFITAYDATKVDGFITLDQLGCAELEENIQRLGVRLLIVDPLVAYMGGDVDLHKANETREVMAGLARIAERCKIAVVVVRHLRKGSADKAIYRGLGSIDITAAVRSVMIIGQDPDDNDGRIICHIKANLTAKGLPIRYYMHNKENPFEWDGPCDVDVEEVLKAQAKTGKSDFDKAVEFLQDAIEGEGKPSDIIKRDAEAQGIDPATLMRARKEVKPKVTKSNGKFYWSMR